MAILLVYTSHFHYGARNSAPLSVFATGTVEAPNGVQELALEYSSISVLASNKTGYEWVAIAGNGTLNLSSLRDIAELMGRANLTNNLAVDGVRMNLTSAYIRVNGTTYDIFTPEQISLIPSGPNNVSVSSSLVIDFTPVLAPAFSRNTTSFIMSPAAIATMANVNLPSGSSIGAKVLLTQSVQASLDAMKPGINITSASITTGGRTTLITATVRDTSGSDVTLNDVFLSGPESASLVPGAANSSATAQITGMLTNSDYNSTGVSADVKEIAQVGLNMQHYQILTFVVLPYGVLEAPSVTSDLQVRGYTIGPGSSANLTFDNTLSYGFNTYQLSPTAGSTYTITVLGQNGTMASATITAH